MAGDVLTDDRGDALTRLGAWLTAHPLRRAEVRGGPAGVACTLRFERTPGGCRGIDAFECPAADWVAAPERYEVQVPAGAGLAAVVHAALGRHAESVASG